MARVRLIDPKVERHLIADEGEVIVDEVEKHWAAMVRPVLGMLLAIPVFALIAVLPSWAYWLPLLGAPILVLHGLWRMWEVRMDRFVITNMRVFRVNGILSQHIATMPITRILDISVEKPVVGRIFGYGHFVFESAAQDQGLREIRYVGRPDERGLTIQRVIQRSGLRGAGVRPPEAPRPTEPQDTWSPPPTQRPQSPLDFGDGWTGNVRVSAPAPPVTFHGDDVRTGPVELPRSTFDQHDTWPGVPSGDMPPASFHPNQIWPRSRRSEPGQQPLDPDGT
ncbi:PH domain-containing protein [Agromyces sp. Marseille-P2726]|uniref:PH domain-containing protein n=1 Tax=Agromyces sp. Marseille-P2726 TaxID=2709132 RepID=UPI00156FBF05|nr:PH domain-containing protein [Agromyces sp. Marseille-P2726]